MSGGSLREIGKGEEGGEEVSMMKSNPNNPVMVCYDWKQKNLQD